MVTLDQEEPVQTLKTLGQCWQGPHTIPSSFHFGLPHSNKDHSGQFPILSPPPSGEGQLFFDPPGREATPQCPKIACHSQLLGWRPSRGAQRQQESTAHVSGTPLKHQLRDAAQEDPACSEVFILFFFNWGSGCPLSFIFLFYFSRNKWIENETKYCHLLWGSLWCSGGFTLPGGFWIRLLASRDWSGKVFRWTKCEFLLQNVVVLGGNEDSLTYLLRIQK